MEDIIDIIVTETTNLIEITSQPTDEIIDVNIIDNREDITLNVTPSVVEININSLTGNFGVNWGEIGGTLSSQTDLNTALGLKADLVDGKVPSSQLPSYVDDVVEVATYSTLPVIGEVGKIYVVLDTNFIYRWSGSAYIEIKDSSAVWGAITGTLSSQTDLQTALNAKFDDPTGDTTQYIAGDGSLITFPIAGQAGTLVREVRNTTGATLTKGTIVYISGATGNKPTVSKAIATGDSTSAQTFGICQSNIANNSNGYVVCSGDIIGLDTSGITEGTQLYLSGTTAGAYTTTKQVAPIHLVYIGVVTRSHPSLGQIEVKIQNGYELDEIHDVLITSKANNDGLFYESSTNLWKNKSIASVLGYTPANAATYVPYTGATQGVNIGTNIYTGGYAILNGSGANQAGVLSLFKGTSRAVQGNGYTNLYAEDGKVGFNDWITGNVRTFEFSLASLTGGTTRVYTLPDASGTIALTSNLSSYVPYTGATGAVNLGAYDLTVNSVKIGLGSGNIYDNIIFGVAALASNTSGGSNIAIGYYSLNANTIGGANVAIGTSALTFNTSGANNTAVGYNALTTNTTGSFNTSIGQGTLSSNTTGTRNVAVGLQSLLSNTTASNNSALGNQSLFYNTTGHDNVSIGYQSLNSNTTGNYNTAIGPFSGGYLTTGGYNTIIGGYAGTAGMSSNVILSDGAGNIRFQWDGTNIKLNGNTVGSNAYTSTAYLPLSGGTLTGAINGTSATFSGEIQTTQGIYINRASLPYIQFAQSGTAFAQIRGNGTTFGLTDANGSTYYLGLNTSTGAATFSSSVTATNLFTSYTASYSAEFYRNNGSDSRINITNTTTTTGADKGLMLGEIGVDSYFYNYATGAAIFGTASTERMRITSAGNVGIGTTTPVSSTGHTGLSISGSSISRLDFMVSDVRKGLIYSYSSGFSITSQGANPLILGTNDTESMRITNGGNLLVGTTTDNGAKLQVNGMATISGGATVSLSSSVYGLFRVNNTTAGSEASMAFYASGDNTNTYWVIGKSVNGDTNNFGFYINGSKASINSSTGVYTPLSDRNKKKDFEDSQIGLNEVLQLKPTLYRMKTDNSSSEKQLGFIAQDVKGIIPSAYVESGEFIGLNFNPIVAALTKAIQELKAELDTLKNK